MTDQNGPLGRAGIKLVAIATLVLAIGSGACDTHERAVSTASAPVLRVGVGQLSATSPLNGLRQLAQIIAVEGLGRLTETGRVEPWIADKWRFSTDGHSLIVTLKSGVKFHDGSPATAETVAALLPG